MTKSQKTLTLTGLGVAASLVTILAVVFVLLNNHAGQTHPISVGSPSPTATTAPSPTPTVDALKTPLPSQGWVTVPALNFAKNMTFSASDPFTGYACGNIGSNARAPLELSITHDGGRTWEGPITTTVPGANCYIYVNPTNSQDIIMLNYDCWGGCGDGIFQPYRSIDGGQTWTQLLLPPSTSSNSVSQPAWIGKTVYFLVEPLPPSGPTHPIIANTSGNALSPIEDTQLFAGTSSDQVAVLYIWANDNTLFAAMNVNGPDLTFAKTNDNGSTWQKFNSAGAIPSNLSTFYSSVNNPLLGKKNNTQAIIKSSDNGMTWQQLPLIPSSNGTYFNNYFIGSTSDGTIVFQLYGRIWELTSGATTWKNVGPEAQSRSTGFIAVSTDIIGRPILAWGGASDKTLAPNGQPQPGIAYHGLNG